MKGSGETDRVLVFDHHLKGDLPWLRSWSGWAPSAHDDSDQ